ncbi:MAG: hypothetical protein EB150_02930 [Nitrososphaeria archaeon]|nr:hypothetical protein [Nitrososphaeria archaeon]NDB88524.1 hypothetical protein [Nitrososphaerota archaeon]NDF26533.1 hypothetical protein [Nitrosopumilaceae archaeon]NDB92230.1 hypothetical protein [Nitrososphaeria archaeon]NDF29155.1 hypothetical protein [Nitrososphaeria archaeon]
MGQFFTDDVDSLLKSGHGDSARLAKIKAEFESTKLVSIDDRKYVEGLISRYSQPTESKPEKIVKIPESRIVPPPPAPKNPPTLLEVKKPRKEEPIPRMQNKTKLRNIAIAAGVTIAAILAVSYFAIIQDQTGPSPINPINTPITKGLELDSTSYAKADLISISGKTNVATQIVKLSITNPAGVEVWSETATVKSNGTFATLLIAGDGWDQVGKYTVTASYSGNTESASFDYTG